MILADLLRRLESLRGPDSNQQWTARCPAHEDEHASLSIRHGENGRILVHCFARCTPDAICEKLGLRLADLFVTPAHERATKGQSQRPIVATYDYRDTAGNLLYQVVRREPKSFHQRRPDGRGGWINNLNGTRRVLYRYPELSATPTDTVIWIVEGEKDADRLHSLGLCATTTPGGAGAVKKVDLSPLEGRCVAIVPDNDDPGRRHAEGIAQLLHGRAKEIRFLNLPGLPPKGDVSDFLDAGRSVADLDRIFRETDPLRSDDVILRPVGTNKATSFALTDTGNAERLVAQQGADLRFCYPWGKWLVWSRGRWKLDDTGQAMARSKRVVRSIRAEAESVADLEKMEELVQWAMLSEKAERRRALIELAKSEEGIPILPEDLDRHPMLLNCRNGTLDLRTGILREASREDRITKIVPIEYDPTAECPVWDAFLERILPDQEVRDFVRRAVGYCLTGEVGEQVLFFCHGLGANGKSTFLTALLSVFGRDYAIQAAPELILWKGKRDHPTELADLFGIRLAVCTEVGAGRSFDEVLVKQLTGGDRIRARRMREDFWEFDPSHHLWIAANHKPVVRGTDEAIWRRILLIPFNVTIPPEERDLSLLQKLEREKAGILAWAVRGCLEWQEEGLRPPEIVRGATREYRADMDVLAGFFEVVLVPKPGGKVRASDAYARYVKWCETTGEDAQSQRDFGLRLTERGLTRRKIKGVQHYVDVALTDDEIARGDDGGPCGPGSDIDGFGPPRVDVMPEAGPHHPPSSPPPPSGGPGEPDSNLNEWG